MADKVVVCITDHTRREEAERFAGKIGALMVDEPGEGLTILFEKEGVSLVGYGLSYRGDFEGMLHRVTKGRLQHEMLAKAAKTAKEMPKAVDATAGMGEDSLLLAAYGYEVTMYEQNPVVALLLRDTLQRAEHHPELQPIVKRMHLVEGNSVELLAQVETEPDLIYLDPMFPARQKSGLINKKLQLIQKLEPPCSAETELFDVAIKANPMKIVVKRPLKSPFLAEKKPSYTLNGKAIRYDCYVIRTK